jgi:hypothetical protein
MPTSVIEPKKAIEIHTKQTLYGDFFHASELAARYTRCDRVFPDLLVLSMKSGNRVKVIARESVHLPETYGHFRKMYANDAHQMQTQLSYAFDGVCVQGGNVSSRFHQFSYVFGGNVVEEILLTSDVVIECPPAKASGVTDFGHPYSVVAPLCEQARSDLPYLLGLQCIFQLLLLSCSIRP